jgi:hypothetical protein
VATHSRPTEGDVRAVRAVIDRLVSENTATARFDGSTHAIFRVALAPPKEKRRGGSCGSVCRGRIEIGLGYAIATLFICEGLLIGGNRPIKHAAARTDVDGNHRFDAVFVDLSYLGRLLHPEASSSWTTTSCPA